MNCTWCGDGTELEERKKAKWLFRKAKWWEYCEPEASKGNGDDRREGDRSPGSWAIRVATEGGTADPDYVQLLGGPPWGCRGRQRGLPIEGGAGAVMRAFVRRRAAGELAGAWAIVDWDISGRYGIFSPGALAVLLIFALATEYNRIKVVIYKNLKCKGHKLVSIIESKLSSLRIWSAKGTVRE
jgi:hypothetical protein